MRTFAELLTTFIRQAGITDSELARSVGVSRQTIFRWREGLTERPNNRDDVTAIADKLRLTPEERDELLLAGGFRPESILESTGESTEQLMEIEEQIDTSEKEDEHTTGFGIDIIPGSEEKKPFFRLSKRLIVCAVAVIILVPLTIWLLSLNGTDNNNTTDEIASNQTTALSSTPAVISPANSGEILILVAPFCPSGDHTGLSDQIAMSIKRESTGNRISYLRVETLTETVDTLKEAEEVRDDNNASLVLSGECRLNSIKLQIIPASGQSYPVMEISGSDTISVNVVSMITLAKACIDTRQKELAFSLITKARNTLTDNAVTNESILTVIDSLLDETGMGSANY